MKNNLNKIISPLSENTVRNPYSNGMKKLIITVLSLVSLLSPAISLAYADYADCVSQGRDTSECQAIFGSPTLKPAGGRDVGQTGSGGGVNADLPNPLKATSLMAVINGLATFMLEASVLIATLLIIFGAFQILTSAGSEDKVASGKKTILYTVIGLGIMLLFKVIIAVIAQLLGVQVNF